MSRKQGTGKRRKIILFRGTTTSTADTATVAQFAEPNSADIEGVIWSTCNNGGTVAPTWSPNTITFNTGIGAWELGLIVNLN